MKRPFLFCCLAVLPLFAAPPEQLTEAVINTRQDIKESTRELIELREAVQQERLALLETVSEKREAVTALRREVDALRQEQSFRPSQQQALRQEVAQLEEEQAFIREVHTDYNRSRETRAAQAELPYLRQQETGTPAQSWQASMEWLARRRGGYLTGGNVLDGKGIEREGTFSVLGPVAYFKEEVADPENSRTPLAGIVILRPESTLPGVYPFEEASSRQELRRLQQFEPAVLPVDVLNGRAVTASVAELSLEDRLRQGGVVMIPLLAIGLLSLLMIMYKFIDLHQLKTILPADVATEIATSVRENSPTLPGAAARVSEPLSSLTESGWKYRLAPREHLEEILHEHVLGVLPRIERSLGMLAVFGGVAPLLGLLGTVTGMIRTFQMVTLFGSGNTTLLSGGISEALVTTAAGLIIAIPILLLHAVLTRRAKAKLSELELSAQQLVNVLQTESHPETAP